MEYICPCLCTRTQPKREGTEKKLLSPDPNEEAGEISTGENILVCQGLLVFPHRVMLTSCHNSCSV